MKTKKKILVEKFTIDPEQGAVAALIGLQRPGYRMSKIIRKGTKATITFEPI